MIDILTSNALFGILLTLILYSLSMMLYRKVRIQLLNPFLVSMAGIILLLTVMDIPLDHYMEGAGYITALLPLTIILLALPLYRQLPLLKEHRVAVLAGIAAGTTTSAVSTIVLCRLFGVDLELIRSIIPKSITTPLGLILTETLGGIASVTVIAIVITGLTGVLLYGPVFRLFRIKHPVAQGVAFGTTSHAIGTAKALELGEVTGAMSGLAIVLAGVATVAAAPLFLLILSVL